MPHASSLDRGLSDFGIAGVPTAEIRQHLWLVTANDGARYKISTGHNPGFEETSLRTHHQLWSAGAPVTEPLATKTGRFLAPIDQCPQSPRGPSYMRVERWVEGRSVGSVTDSQATMATVGRTLGKFHAVGLSIERNLGIPQFVADAVARWDGPLHQLHRERPQLSATLAGQLPFLRNIEQAYNSIRMDERFRGVTHGDMSLPNVIKEPSGKMTLIDFDLDAGLVLADVIKTEMHAIRGETELNDQHSYFSAAGLRAVGALHKGYLASLDEAGLPTEDVALALHIRRVETVDYCLQNELWRSDPRVMKQALANVEQSVAMVVGGVGFSLS